MNIYKADFYDNRSHYNGRCLCIHDYYGNYNNCHDVLYFVTYYVV